jgi:hypothetical protein
MSDKDYTIEDIIKEFEERGKKSFLYLSECQKETFMLDKLVSLTNRIQELENERKANR